MRFKTQHVHLRGDGQAAVFCPSLSNLPPICPPKCGGMFGRLSVYYHELPVLPRDWWSTWGVIISPDENSPGSFSTPFLPSSTLVWPTPLSVSKLSLLLFLLHVSFHQTPSLLIQSSTPPLLLSPLSPPISLEFRVVINSLDLLSFSCYHLVLLLFFSYSACFNRPSVHSLCSLWPIARHTNRISV